MNISIPTDEKPASEEPSGRSRFARFFRWPTEPKARRRAQIIVVILVLAIIGGGVAYAWNRQKKNVTPAGSDTVAQRVGDQTQPAAATAVSVLDGVSYDTALAARRPLAVMVENHPDARPQYGLSRASIVYEAIAEGGITRYMAIFGPKDADKIGPIRSARTYYIDWMEEYNAVYVHAGGAANALAKLAATKSINQIDQQNAPTMWRWPHNGVASEHTLYSSTSQLRDYATKQGWSMTINAPGWTYVAETRSDADRAAAPIKTISIPFSSALFTVGYTYEPTTNVWQRTLAAKADVDALTSERISPTNVIIQVMQRRDIPEPGNKIIGDLTLYGSGVAWVAKGGNVTKGTWKKEKEGSRTRYYDDAGAEISLLPGQTFVEVIQPDTTPIFK